MKTKDTVLQFDISERILVVPRRCIVIGILLQNIRNESKKRGERGRGEIPEIQMPT